MGEVKKNAIERQFFLAEIDGEQRVVWWTNNSGAPGWTTADREGCTIHHESVVGERTSLSFFPEGTGVWIEGVSAEELRQKLSSVASLIFSGENSLTIDAREWLNSMCNSLAQLSDRESAGGEDYKIGDVISARFIPFVADETRYRYEKTERNNGDGFDLACWKNLTNHLTYRLDELSEVRLESKSQKEEVPAPSPAKVGIELTEPVSAEDLHWFFGNIRTTPNHPEHKRLMEIFHILAASLPHLPPVEVEEPKEPGAIIEVTEHFANTPRFRWRYVSNGKLWFLVNGNGKNPRKFSEFVDPVLISPRVIGGEK